MKYLIRQKIFFQGQFYYKNEFNEDCFKVYGKILTIGNKLFLTDMHDRELFYIEQRLLRFCLSIQFIKTALRLQRLRFTLMRPSFDITSSFGYFHIDGNFLAYDFTIFKDGTRLPLCQKNGFHCPTLTVFRFQTMKTRPLSLLL